MRLRERRSLVPLALLAALAVAAILLGAGRGGSESPPLGVAASSWRGLVGAPRPTASVGQRMLVVLRAPSLASRVARAGGLATDAEERQWTAEAYAAQKQLLAELGAHGLRIALEYSYARVLNGFSAAVDARTAALLERSPEVAGVYPVRVAYPSHVPGAIAAGSAVTPDVALPGYDGHGVTIALLDTGVDRTQPFLRGRVLQGADVLSGAPTAAAQRNPDDPSQVERHGTETAGLIVGAGGPPGAAGGATGATILPIPVAGWQLDAENRPAVFPRSDQLIAGLELAVDPNGDGDAHDAARIALVALSEPYAAFADSPESRAVAGALGLDTLVVAAAGNDGPAGPGYGSVSGPGGAAGAVTVGAADLRPRTVETRLVLRAGLHIGFDRFVPLAGAVLPLHAVDAPAAAPATHGSLEGLFDASGFSLVAGRVALLPAGERPSEVAAQAARAGAVAVVLYGRPVPPGSIGLDEAVGIPVVSVDAATVRPMLRAIHAGSSAGVSIGAPRSSANGASGRVASFSSRGLAFDGRLKPDLVAPGVALLAAEPGASEFGSVSGTSAAAAVVAGAAAVLAQTRPSLPAAQLRGLLIGTAHPIPQERETAQGTGLVDLGGAASAELEVEPPTLPLGRATRAGRTFRRTIVLRSLSPRPLRVFVGPRLEGDGAAAVSVTPSPSRVLVPPRATARVTLKVQVLRIPAGREPVVGVLDLTVPSGSGTTRTPLTLTFQPAGRSLIRNVTLSTRRIEPSDAAPAVLSVAVGRVSGTQRPQVEPVQRLDLQLYTAYGRPLGLLARLRDLLPGRYVFGLTGRGPGGAVLRPGAYRIRLVATPTDGGPPSVARVRFTIK